MPRYDLVCDECGGTDLEFDAYAVWDRNQQAFIFADTMDSEGPYCRDCGGRVPYSERRINDNHLEDD